MTARAAAEQLLGRPAAAVWSSPGRANLIGEHTDYNDGFVLPFAIERRTYAAAALRDDGILRVASTFAERAVEVPLVDLPSLFDGSPGQAVRDGEIPEWAAYAAGVAWAALLASGGAVAKVPGVDLAIASDVPVGAGLSSSAAIEGAVVGALDALWDLGLTPLEMARIGRRAENEAVGAPTGIMDQVASIMGRPDAATLLDCRSLETRAVPLGLAGEGLGIAVIDTRTTHAHSTGGYGDRRAACERGAAELGVPALRDVEVDDLPRAERILDPVTFRRVRHIVTENDRVRETVRVLETEGPRAIGELLAASHASMRDDFEISTPELDTAVDAALAAGAVGARMTGGGFGGSALAVIECSRFGELEAAARESFARQGFREPHVFEVTPSEGLRAER